MLVLLTVSSILIFAIDEFVLSGDLLEGPVAFVDGDLLGRIKLDRKPLRLRETLCMLRLLLTG